METSASDLNSVAELIGGWVDPDAHREPRVRCEALLASLAFPDDLRDVQWVDPVYRDDMKDLIARKARRRGLRLPDSDLFER